MKDKEQKMVIIITKKGGTTSREVIGDDLGDVEIRFVQDQIREILNRYSWPF